MQALEYKISNHKTQGIQLGTDSESKINPPINPVNNRGTCPDKTYCHNIWNIAQRGFITNFIFIAPILTELSAEIVKLTHYLHSYLPKGYNPQNSSRQLIWNPPSWMRYFWHFFLTITHKFHLFWHQFVLLWFFMRYFRVNPPNRTQSSQ